MDDIRSGECTVGSIFKNLRYSLENMPDEGVRADLHYWIRSGKFGLDQGRGKRGAAGGGLDCGGAMAGEAEASLEKSVSVISTTLHHGKKMGSNREAR